MEEASAQLQCGAFAHGCSLLTLMWAQGVGSGSQGSTGGEVSSLLSPPTANFWVVWTHVSTLPLSLPLLLPAALKSPVASLFPDVASRCGLEQFR